MCGLMTALWAIAIVAPQAQAGAMTADEVMRNVRQSTGLIRQNLPPHGLELIGSGEFTGLPARYRVAFDREGRFVQMTEARVNMAVGFDGRRAWTMDIGGERREEDLAGREIALFSGLLVTGMWIDAGSGLVYSLKDAGGEGGVCTLAFKGAEGVIDGTFKIDTKTWMPLECSFNAEGQSATYAWSGILEHAGVKFPRRVTASSGGSVVDVMNFESARPLASEDRSLEAPDLTPLADSEFDALVPAELEVKRAKTGHLLVRPKVNGKDAGWFILDTGAGANVLATRVIQELGLESFGEIPAIGVGGVAKSGYCRPASFSLGRLTWKDPLMVGLDLSFLDAPLGVPINGIVGYGTFYRSVLEIDLERAVVALYDPKGYDLGRVGGRWQTLYQIARVSCVEAEFEGHRGVFKLDTGAAGTTVAIHAPAVERFKLLEGRETRDSATGGVGGVVKAKEGTLAYFEIGGVRTEKVPALFATSRGGAFNSSTTLGNIGGDLVKPFRIVFDYQNKRVAFAKRGD